MAETLQPTQGIRVKQNKTYVFDPNYIEAQVGKSEEWATKTDGKVKEKDVEIDYSSKAYAIGGVGTEQNNAKYYKEKADFYATSAAKDAATAQTAANDENVVAVGEDIRSSTSLIKNVAYNKMNIITVAGIEDNINTVASSIENIGSVASNISSINAVNENKNNINSVNNNKTNIDKVANNQTNINTTATNISAINNCSSNMSAIKDAPNQANRAKQYADKAQAVTEGTLNETQITNCITEIPQDIKLELNNGTLTLKAGSKVYVPNGPGVFDVVNITSDKNFTYSSNGQVLIITDSLGNMSRCVYPAESGSTEPASKTTGTLWYDTTNNYCKRWNGSAWENRSLPIAIVTVSGGQITSIDQVFNGFGYIGSTAFALPGVKGLAPDGRNEDGSLKNSVKQIGKVSVRNFSGGNRTAVFAFVDNDLGFGIYVYDSQINRNKENNNLRSNVIFGSGTFIYGKFTSLTPKTPFHAVDYNDAVLNYGDQDIGGNKNFTGTLKAPTPSSATDNSTNVATTAWTNNFLNNKKTEIAGWGMPNYSAGIDIAIRSNDETYTCPADGWVAITSLNSATSYIGGYIYNQNTNVAVTFGGQYCSGGGIMPVCKDNVIVIKNKGNNQPIDYFRFYPRIGG